MTEEEKFPFPLSVFLNILPKYYSTFPCHTILRKCALESVAYQINWLFFIPIHLKAYSGAQDPSAL